MASPEHAVSGFAAQELQQWPIGGLLAQLSEQMKDDQRRRPVGADLHAPGGEFVDLGNEQRHHFVAPLARGFDRVSRQPGVVGQLPHDFGCFRRGPLRPTALSSGRIMDMWEPVEAMLAAGPY